MEPVPAPRPIVTLGGPATFAGQATAAFAERYPRLPPVTYRPSVTGVLDAVRDGTAGAAVLSGETAHTVTSQTVDALVSADDLFVTAELTVPYRCHLLGREGTPLDAVTRVVGHGSLQQCRGFLAEHLPGAEAVRHTGNSALAAREVTTGDGRTAVVGTARLAAELGLAVLARDIDRGSAAVWWLISGRPAQAARPDRIVCALTGAQALPELSARLAVLGLTPRSVLAVPTGVLFGNRYLVTAVRTGPPLPGDEIARALPARVRLAGAFDTTKGDMEPDAY